MDLFIIYGLPIILAVGVWYQTNRWISAGKPTKLLFNHQAVRRLGINLFGIQIATPLLFLYLINNYSIQIAMIAALTYSGLGIYLVVIKELTVQESPKPEKTFKLQREFKEPGN